MQAQWISPVTITGDAATGQKYLRREHINEYFWREVAKGNHILFVAPRRVGKTSIMQDLADNPLPGYTCIYQNIEGVKTKNEFYKRLFELVSQCIEKSKTEKTISLFARWVRKYSIEEITKSGIKFKSKDLDFEKELRNIIPELVNADRHTVIFLDEFSEVINKLKKQDKAEDAIDILHTLRELRSDAGFRKFTLVYAGSVGLQFVIKSIGRLKLINDLHPVQIGALTAHEAKQLVNQLTNNATIRFADDMVAYLQTKINHLLPYYIQLMIEEVDVIARETGNPNVGKEMIDNAFARVLKTDKNFEDWLTRLKEYQPAHFPFINEILKKCAHHNRITVQEIYDLALDEKYDRQDDYMDFVHELIDDGYLVDEQKHIYRFISPFLQEFWLRKYPILND